MMTWAQVAFWLLLEIAGGLAGILIGLFWVRWRNKGG